MPSERPPRPTPSNSDPGGERAKFLLEAQIAKYVERGMGPKEARALAEREFAAPTATGADPSTGPVAVWEEFRRDVRFAVRSLRRTPGFTFIAVLCLALGIGANAAIFSVVNAVLLRPFPYEEPERLVRVWESGNDGFTGTASMPNFRDWVAENQGFEAMAAYQNSSVNLTGSGEATRLRALTVSANLFQLLGAPAMVGRTFLPEEDQPGKRRVAVLGNALWRGRFGSDPSVVGRTLTLDGEPYTVVGVMPRGFDFPVGPIPTDLYVPLDLSPQREADRGSHFLHVVARLKDGWTRESAMNQLKQVAARIEQAYPNEQAGRSVLLRDFRENAVGRVKPALLVLLGAVGLVLLIACANVANLQLARGAARRHEIAVRVALGASRARLVVQLLVESLMLAGAGALVGLLFARLGLGAMAPLTDRVLPLVGGIPLDQRVFLFLLLVAGVSGIAFGLIPALQLSRTNVRDSLISAGGKSSGGVGQQRLRQVLVVAEMALSLVLLVGAGLLIRGFYLLQATPPGLAASNVLTAHIGLPKGRISDVEMSTRFVQPLLERIRAIPGVREAGSISMLPLQSAYTNTSYNIDGRPKAEPGKEPIVEIRSVSPTVFDALGVPLRLGRELTEQDGTSGPPVVLVNDAFVKREFPNEDPIGRRISTDEDAPPYTIVGVVGSVRQAGLDLEPLPEMYLPLADTSASWWSEVVLVIKSDIAPQSIAPAVRDAVRSVAPDQPLYLVQSMEEVITQSMADRRLNLWLLGVFAGLALVLSAAGLYGVISYLVAQRTREIGIRMALGAQTNDVTRLVLRDGAVLAVIGLGIGVAGALGLTRLLQSLLYGVSPRDPIVFAVITALLASVALVASFLPARRAARLDPLLALRSE